MSHAPELLTRQTRCPVSRGRFLVNVWGTHDNLLNHRVDVYIRRLRSKIDDGRARELIHTVRGLGHWLE